MNQLDESLFSAVDELRQDLDGLEIRPFTPRRRTAPVIAMLAVVLLGAVALAGSTLLGDDASEVITTTVPEVRTDPTTVPTAVPTIEPERESADPVVIEEPTAQVQAGPVTTQVQAGPVTSAAEGEFLLPLHQGSAWNADGTRVLLYRTSDGTGDVSAGYEVLDTSTGRVVQEFGLVAPDIEQVYWSPTDPSVLLYLEDADLVALDVDSGQPSVVHTFAGCLEVDSGLIGVAPSPNGSTFGVLCREPNAVTSMIAFDLATNTEVRRPTDSDIAPSPSPSGELFVNENPNGTVTVMDRQLNDVGVTWDLNNDGFVFVTDAGGSEWLAAATYNGDWVGTLVLFPLDPTVATEPVVVIGPDAGFVYPPSGTQLSGSGSHVAISVAGEIDAEGLAGMVLVVDVADPAAPQITQSFAHGSTDQHGWWSTVFVSLSRSGDWLAYSTDANGPSVDTVLVDVAG